MEDCNSLVLLSPSFTNPQSLPKFLPVHDALTTAKHALRGKFERRLNYITLRSDACHVMPRLNGVGSKDCTGPNVRINMHVSKVNSIGAKGCSCVKY